MTSAYLGFKGLQNALISRCETHSGLCDRLDYSCLTSNDTARICREECVRGAGVVTGAGGFEVIGEHVR
jgi:hypothetical protein